MSLKSKMLEKLTALLLTISCASKSFAQTHEIIPVEDKGSLTASYCVASGLDCVCFGPAATARIADEIQAHALCKYERDQFKKLQVVAEEKSWVHDPTMTIAGVAIGFSIGGLVGYLIATKTITH